MKNLAVLEGFLLHSTPPVGSFKWAIGALVFPTLWRYLRILPVRAKAIISLLTSYKVNKKDDFKSIRGIR